MKAVFADTYYSLAILNRDDDAHERAVAASGSVTARTVTTAWVLTEVADAMAGRNARGVFSAFLGSLRRDADVTIVPPQQALFDAGIALYADRRDKEWSLTDCISFVVMREHGLTDALTADHHFEQAGFRALLREGEARGG